MFEDGGDGWLAKAQSSLAEVGIKPTAVAALDRPTLAGRVWTDGSLSVAQVQELLAGCATELAAQGLLEGARVGQNGPRLPMPGDQPYSVVVAPKQSPRIAAVVQTTSATDLNAISQALSKAVVRHEAIEMAAALSDATGAAVALASGNNLEFASRAAFVQSGATGPFLGLACLSRTAPDAVSRLFRAVQGDPTAATATVRRENVGPFVMACFVKKIGENNLAMAASRFGLTRAELAEAENMIAGLSCKESASRLKISPETVRQRRKVIYRKLGVESCGTAVARILDLELPSGGEAQAAFGGVNTLAANGGLRAR